MKTKPIPAIIMLIAGFVACVIGICQHMDMELFLKTVLITMLVFLVLGQVVRIILDRNIEKMADPKEETEEENTSDDETEELKKEESDGEEE
ncbi:MAG: hypothetical protein ACI4ES_02270 [Roseburia sp.]